MKYNCVFLIGLIALALTATGCQTTGGRAVAPGQQQVFNGGLPSAGQAQQAVGQFGRNIGSRFANGIINRGVNSVLNGVF